MVAPTCARWRHGADSAMQVVSSKIDPGTVSERPKVQLSKSCVGESPPWVQIPPAYHRQLCQVFLSAPIVVTESNRAGSLMSSGLPSARVADTGSRVAE